MTLPDRVGATTTVHELRTRIVDAVRTAESGRAVVESADIRVTFALTPHGLDTEIAGLDYDRPDSLTRIVDDVWYTLEPNEEQSGRPWKTVELNGMSPDERNLREMGRRAVMVGFPFTMLGWLREQDIEVVDRTTGLTTFRVLVPFQGLARAAGDLSAEPMKGEDTETFWDIDEAGFVREVRTEGRTFRYSDWGTAAAPVAPPASSVEGLLDWQIRLMSSVGRQSDDRGQDGPGSAG